MKVSPHSVHSSHKHLRALNLKKCSWRSYSVSLRPQSLRKTILNVLKANLQERENIETRLESLKKQKQQVKVLQENPTRTFEKLLEKIKKDIPEEILQQSDNIDIKDYLPHDLTDKIDGSSPEWQTFCNLFLFISTLSLVKNPEKIIQYTQDKMNSLGELEQELQSQGQRLEGSIYHGKSKCPLSKNEIEDLIESIEGHHQELKKTDAVKSSLSGVDSSVGLKNDLMDQILNMVAALDV